jgi:hypothetical protein
MRVLQNFRFVVDRNGLIDPEQVFFDARSRVTIFYAGFPMENTLNKCDVRFFMLSTIFAMNAAPGGAPPRRIKNREHLKKQGTAPPCRTEALKRGALISVIFMIRV